MEGGDSPPGVGIYYTNDSACLGFFRRVLGGIGRQKFSRAKEKVG